MRSIYHLFILIILASIPEAMNAQTYTKIPSRTAVRATTNAFDAAFDNRNGKVYLFKGTQYLRMDAKTIKVDPGYPRSIKANWIGLPWTSIDAAFYRESNKRIYMFKGKQYVRITGSKVDPGYPKSITEWKGLRWSKVDAAIDNGNGMLYFFSGNSYVKINSVNSTVLKGYPVALNSGNWKGVKWTSLDAATHYKSKKKNYFFKGSYFSRLSFNVTDASYPKKTADYWPSKKFITLPVRANTTYKPQAGSTKPDLNPTKLPVYQAIRIVQNDVFITFENKTDRTVEVFNVHSDDTERKFLTLAPGKAEKHGTFKDKKYRVKDQASGFTLHQFVTSPKSETIAINKDPNMTFPTTPIEVTVNWLNEPSVVTHPDVVIEAVVSSLDNLREQLLFNNVRLEDEQIEKSQEDGKLKISASVQLLVGENTFKLEVFTKDGQLVEAPEIMVKYKKNLKQVKPNLYLFGIGVSKYEDEAFNTLTYPAKDVKDIEAAFKKQENGLVFDRVFSRILLDEEATERNIKKELLDFFKGIQETDYIMFVVSSHGIVAADNIFYILQHDVEKEHIEATAISETLIQDRLKNLPASKILLIDACNSGGLSGDKLKAVTATEKTVSQLLKKVQKNSKGAYILTSSSEDEFSIENEKWENGAFTEAILMGLEGQSYTLLQGGRAGEVVEVELDNGVLTMDALVRYVQVVAADLSGYKQEPYSEKSGQDLPIYVGE